MVLSAFDLLKNVLHIDGTEAKMHTGVNDEVAPFTIKTAFRKALDGLYVDERPSQQNPSQELSPVDRLKRYEISKKIWHAEADVTLTAEEAVELKKCVFKFFASPEICGFLEAIIENKNEQEKQ